MFFLDFFVSQMIMFDIFSGETSRSYFQRARRRATIYQRSSCNNYLPGKKTMHGGCDGLWRLVEWNILERMDYYLPGRMVPCDFGGT